MCVLLVGVSVSSWCEFDPVHLDITVMVDLSVKSSVLVYLM